jgi:alpha-galactosidase
MHARNDSAPPFYVHFEGCHARREGNRLVIGNALVERVWEIGADGSLTPVSLVDRQSAREWLTSPGRQPVTATMPLPAAPRQVSITSQTGRRNTVEQPSLRVTLSVQGESATLIHTFQVFAESAAILTRLEVQSAATSTKSDSVQHAMDAPVTTGIETTGSAGAAEMKILPDVVESLTINPLHHTFTRVQLADQTDRRDNLVFETVYHLHPNERLIEAAGNIFFLEDKLTGDGLLMVKLAPLPESRPVKNPVDLRIEDSHVTLLGHGADSAFGAGYAHAVIPYRGSRPGRIAAMQTFQRQLRPYVAGRDGLIASNTWGDRNRDARINEPFLEAEIAAAAALGVDVVQVDDGWQKGRTANSAQREGGVWNGFWAADPNFWSPHPERLPNGVARLVQLARERELRFGLWFAPDSSNDMANWQRDADVVLRFHREWGADCIKVDAIKMHSRATEHNLACFYEKVLAETHGKVVFDHDVTAEIRPGYLGATHVGNIYVENRYTDWHRYWPHHTLRNLWLLSQYIDPVRLRMEFLNSARNTDKYAGDPLAPAEYSPDYLFATVMVSSPLAFMEVQNLPADHVEKISRLIRIWKAHRDQFHAQPILPIGQPPDGTAWTGFLSWSEKSHQGYLLVFRELNDQPATTIALPIPQDISMVEILAGTGTLKLRNATAELAIPQPRQYLFARIR